MSSKSLNNPEEMEYRDEKILLSISDSRIMFGNRNIFFQFFPRIGRYDVETPNGLINNLLPAIFVKKDFSIKKSGLKLKRILPLLRISKKIFQLQQGISKH